MRISAVLQQRRQAVERRGRGIPRPAAHGRSVVPSVDAWYSMTLFAPGVGADRQVQGRSLTSLRSAIPRSRSSASPRAAPGPSTSLGEDRASRRDARAPRARARRGLRVQARVDGNTAPGGSRRRRDLFNCAPTASAIAGPEPDSPVGSANERRTPARHHRGPRKVRERPAVAHGAEDGLEIFAGEAGERGSG